MDLKYVSIIVIEKFIYIIFLPKYTLRGWRFKFLKDILKNLRKETTQPVRVIFLKIDLLEK